MHFKFYEDSEGNQSSKRVAGFLMVTFAMGLAFMVFVFSFFQELRNTDVILDVIHLFTFSGAGLLGIGVIENFSKTK